MSHKFLAACHCGVSHDELMQKYKDGTTKSFRTDPQLKGSIQYVDVKCEDPNEFVSWKDVANDSIDFIWSIGCPIYLIPDGDEKPIDLVFEALTDLLREGWRVLKLGGELMIPMNEKAMQINYPQKLVNFHKKYTSDLGWEIYLVDKSEFEYVVEKKTPITIAVKYIILKKNN